MLPKALTNTSTTKAGKKVVHLAWWVTFILSMALSVGTWNPTGYHFIHYISVNIDNILNGFTPFAILMMFALWMLAIKSIFQSLKLAGAITTVIILMAFVWGLQEYNILDLTELTQIGWIATLGMGFLIWFGLNASIIWKKLTGVYTTDSTEEG